MSELQDPETGQAEETLLLTGYLKPKDLAKALDVSERTIARWHHFREGPPRVEIGRKVYYRKESVMAWVASCEHPEPRANRARRPRPRVAEPSSIAIPPERNDLSSLPRSRGGHD